MTNDDDLIKTNLHKTLIISNMVEMDGPYIIITRGIPYGHFHRSV